jgi:hypothetical protein
MSPRAYLKGQFKTRTGFLARFKFRARFVLTLSVVACCALEFSSVGARAGFLDDLIGVFAGDQRPAARRDYVAPVRERRTVRRHVSSLSYLPRRERRPRKAAARPAPDRLAAASAPEARDGLCYIVRPLGFDISKTDTILHDATLREGDSVMTAQGVRVFQGGSACPHKESDFLALAAARDVPKSKRGALVAIEKAMRAPILNAQAGSFAEGQHLTARP